MSNYQPVIGLEVHVELNTKTKMFCRCSADYFGKEPNSQTCPVCLGLPGALPYINEEAIKKCIRIGLALGCKINPVSYFERKNYFYPDLPKGYQISQLVLPIAVGGEIEVENDKGEKTKVRINRAHQEEDTAKLTHQFGIQNSKFKSKNEEARSLVDFNRSGVPLVEIVTEPDFTDSSQIRDYAKKLQDIFRETGVSNADMERGDMRLEANVSVRLIGQQELPSYRIELKNINSFRFMVAAVEYEIKRQSEALERREKLFQETRGWNEAKKQTYLQRSKEEAHDYRYFPDPDLPKLRIRSDLVEKLREQVEQKHPKNKIKRWELLGVPYNSGATIIRQGMSNFFEEAVKIGESEGVAAQKIANYIINQKVDLVDSSPKQVVDDVAGKSMGVIGDTGELEKLANEAISENPKIVEDYKKGKESAVQALIGVVMKKTSGKAEPSVTKKCLEKMLKI